MVFKWLIQQKSKLVWQLKMTPLNWFQWYREGRNLFGWWPFCSRDATLRNRFSNFLWSQKLAAVFLFDQDEGEQSWDLSPLWVFRDNESRWGLSSWSGVVTLSVTRSAPDTMDTCGLLTRQGQRYLAFYCRLQVYLISLLLAAQTLLSENKIQGSAINV